MSLTEQSLLDAEQDLGSLEDIINGPDDGAAVVTRLGRLVKPVARVIRELAESVLTPPDYIGPKGDPGGNVMAIGLFTAAAGMGIANGTDIVRTSGYSVVGIGNAEYVYDATVDAAYVAAHPRTSFLAASGRGFRLCLEQRISVTQFGAIGDGLAGSAGNNDTAFQSARDLLATSALGGYGYGRAGPALYAPPSKAGPYCLNSTIDLLEAGMKLYSDGGPYGGGAVLQWLTNVTGIRIQVAGGSGAAGTGGVNPGGAGTEVCGLTLVGAYAGGGAAESEAHAFHLRSHSRIHDCAVRNWAGDGLYGKDDIIDELAIHDMLIEMCRNGYSFEGVDTQVMVLNNVHTSSNRRYGYWMKLGLGSIWVGGNSSTNGELGVGGAVPYIMCTYLGNRYYALPNQEVWQKANPPSGTTANNQGWGYLSPGGAVASIPAWANTINFRSGGHGRIEGAYQLGVNISTYHEADQPPLQIEAGGMLYLSQLTGRPVMFTGAPWGGAIEGTAAGLTVAGSLTVGNGVAYGYPVASAAITVRGDGYLTRDAGIAYDPTFHINSTSNYGTLQFEFAGTLKGMIQYYNAGGGASNMYYLLTTPGVHLFYINGVNVANVTADGLELAAGKVVKVNGVQVLGTQGAAIADAAHSVAAPTKAEFDALVDKYNTLLARLRVATGHGIIA